MIKAKETLATLLADVWFFDSDATLYPSVAPMQEAIREKIIEFISVFFSISIGSARELRMALLKKHATRYTVQAMAREGVDRAVFIRDTYLAVDPHDYGISRDDVLRREIDGLPGKKFVLTNNVTDYARRIAQTIGIETCFDSIIGMDELEPFLKPSNESFIRARQLAGAGEYDRCVLVDNNISNILTAHSLDWRTILVNADRPDIVPDLWIPSLDFIVD